VKVIFSIVLRASISIVMLFFLFKWIGIKKIIGVTHTARWELLCLTGLLFLLIYILCFFRWCLLLKSAGVNAPFGRLVVSYAGGIFFNLFLPSTIGGDFVRIADLTNHAKRTREIAATVLLDRLSGFVALSLIVLISIGLGHAYIKEQGILNPVLILFSMVLIMVWIFFTKNLFSKLKMLIPVNSFRIKAESLHAEIFFFRKKKKVLLDSLLISLLAQIAIVFSYYLIFLSLGYKLNLIFFFIAVPLINVAAMIPLSIGGLGIRDMGSAFFFAKVGITKDIAVAASLLNFSFMAIASILCGIIYVVALHNRWLQRGKKISGLER